MAFRLRARKSVRKSIQRIAREQLDKALDEIDDKDLDRHETVHQVRKRCKKIRGLIRLVRPQFKKTYRLENDWYRDAACSLSYVRDAQSIIETFDKLMQRFDDQVERRAFAPVRRQLTSRLKKVAQDNDVGERLADFRGRLEEGRKRISAWRLQDDGFDAVAGGLTNSYSSGRKAMQQAYESPTSEAFHEWRKRAKHHWYHVRLLRPIWKEGMNARRHEARLLSDFLGDDHDLAVLHETLTASPDAFGDREMVQTLHGLIVQRQQELRQHARPLGERLFAEKPKHFRRRMHSYWNAWRREAGE